MTGEAIDWLDEHEELYDAWMLVAYAATSCALVQVRSRKKCDLYVGKLNCNFTERHSRKVPHMGKAEGCRSSEQAAQVTRLCSAVGDWS